MSAAPLSVRAAAARALGAVLAEGRSLSQELPAAQTRVAGRDRALLQELCYGVCRWQPRLEFWLNRLLQRPFKPRDADVRALLLTGIYQLEYLRIPDHAAVAATVEATGELGKQWARGLANAVLRNFQRQAEALRAAADKDEVAAHAHPAWLLAQLQQAYPGQWREIVAANNARPPMTLRVNRRVLTCDEYLQQLASAGIAATPAAYAEAGIMLEAAQDVMQLPGFGAGWVSVQDAAAQLAAPLLAPAAGDRVLDACAAPGGKTAHLLEYAPAIAELVAIDHDPERLARVRDTLARLQLAATCIADDAATPAAWWDGLPFDRILLDAPCSATGVIRRHPDIKLLRRTEDIATLAQTQARLLRALWPLLRPGGRLLYVTCSILPQENERQMQAFLAATLDAVELPIVAEWGAPRAVGRQILPGVDGMDGFYYALLGKRDD